MEGLVEQASAVARGEVLPEELVEAALRAVERNQGLSNALTSVLAEEALREAGQRHGVPSRGPLHGVPVVVKELFDVAGVPTTGCCAAYEGRRAATDSDVVLALRSAGAVVLGKANQHELACGATNLVSSFGPVAHPQDPSRIAGGSSGGSAAAVGTGMTALAIGSDTGGSIRIPASFCGLTGFKPTHGAVSLRGAMPVCPDLDTAGPMARTARECAVAFSILARSTPGAQLGAAAPPAPNDSAFAGRRVGLPAPFFRLIHSETRRAVEAMAVVLESLGAVVVPLDGPEIDDEWAGSRFIWGDFARLHRPLWGDPRVHPEVARLMELGREMGGLEYARSRERAREIRDGFAAALGRVDVLLAPATPYPAPRPTDTTIEVEGGSLDVHRGGPARLTAPVNLAGLPALALPVGRSSEGLPLGAQLIGRRWSDRTLLGLGIAYQDAVA